MLGSDARVKGTKEPGANVGGPSRSDTILLMRVGGGRAAAVDPARHVADIPGHGTDKINAAYAYGGPALAIQTVKQFLGIDVNHLIEVNFANFPAFIDSLGGMNYTGGCVVSRINGGFKNGGYTLRLRRGTNHLDGKQALALARTRKNECNARENDLSRARRQQKILSAIKSRLLPDDLPAPPVRLLAGPEGGPLGHGRPRSARPLRRDRDRRVAEDRVLRGSPQGSGLVVPDDVKRREVQRFLNG